MAVSHSQELKLRLGNFFLAAMFSIVPTAMTIGFLGTHGYLLCRRLDQRIELNQPAQLKEICIKSNLDANYSYIIWIWMFITIPTWRWFYIWHYKRVKTHTHSK